MIKIIIMTLAAVSLLFMANSCEESLGLEDNVLLDTLNTFPKVIKRDTVILHKLQDSAIIGNTIVVVDTAIIYQITELRQQNDSLYEVIDSVIKSIQKPYKKPVIGTITNSEFKLIYRTLVTVNTITKEIERIEKIELDTNSGDEQKCIADINSLIPRVYIESGFLSKRNLFNDKLAIADMSFFTDTNEITKTIYAEPLNDSGKNGNFYSYILKFDTVTYPPNEKIPTKFYYGEFSISPEVQGVERYFTGKLFIESNIDYKGENILLQGYIAFKFEY